MPGKHCKRRKHTPIVTERERRFFGAEYGRKKAGKKGKTGMPKAVLRRHLKEAGGKSLPLRSKKKARKRRG